MQKINQEKVFLERAIADYKELTQNIEDGLVLLEMAVEAEDEESFNEVKADLSHIEAKIADLELKSLLNGEVDANTLTFQSMREPAAPKRRIGLRCCCACTRGGRRSRATESKF